MISDIKAILLDIEGTTTPIDFVHKTLFPYSRERVTDFVRANFDKLGDEISQLKKDHGAESSYLPTIDESRPETIAEYLCFLIDNDRKSTPLKSIQGKIWQQGYISGELRSEVFEDVPRAFRRWSRAKKRIAIYSSGSKLAQRDLFRFTDHGDLTPFISSYFDTTTGSKLKSESYSKIAEELEITPGRILFVSDIIAELDAARQANMQTVLSVRNGNAPVTGIHLPRAIRSLDELDRITKI